MRHAFTDARTILCTVKGLKTLSISFMLTAFTVWVMLRFRCVNMNSLGGRKTDRLGNELERSEWRLGPTNWITADCTESAEARR